MTQSSRKFVGIFAIIGSIIVYSAAAVAIYLALPAGLPGWLLIIYFAIAGIGWVFPAGWLIKWMARPDPDDS